MKSLVQFLPNSPRNDQSLKEILIGIFCTWIDNGFWTNLITHYSALADKGCGKRVGGGGGGRKKVVFTHPHTQRYLGPFFLKLVYII
jgi:hypothetical protein